MSEWFNDRPTEADLSDSTPSGSSYHSDTLHGADGTALNQIKATLGDRTDLLGVYLDLVARLAALDTTVSGKALASALTTETARALAAEALLQPLDSDLTAIAALTTTSYGRAFLALADAAAGRTALGLGTAATTAASAYDAAGAAAAAQAASQPLDSDLTAIAALTTTSFGRAVLALADAAALRTAAGLGTAAVVDTGTGAGNVPTITQADARYDAAGAATAGDASALTNLLGYLGMSATAVDTAPRSAASQAFALSVSGTLYLAYFTPLVNLTVSTITVWSSTAGASSITIGRVGLYTAAANGDATLVARSANDTTFLNSFSTAYAEPFATAGGYPASYALVAGTRYAVGVLQVGTPGRMLSTGPGGNSSTIGTIAPLEVAQKVGQSDMDSNITGVAAVSAVAGGVKIYARLT